MTYYGKIASYDTNKGTGTIKAEEGGDTLMFAKADLKHSDQAPHVDQRFGYETESDGGKTRAVGLQLSKLGNDAGNQGKSGVIKS